MDMLINHQKAKITSVSMKNTKIWI